MTQHFSCPMHPEVHGDKPGDCPICGMALNLMQGEGSAIDPEQAAITRRFWGTLPLTLIVFVLTMAPMMGITWVSSFDAYFPRLWSIFLLTTPVVFWGAAPFFKKGWRALLRKNPNMFTLIAMGIGISYLFSCVMLVINSPLNHQGGMGLYFESAAMITTLILLGQVLEYRTSRLTQTAVRSLQGLMAKTARIVDMQNVERDIPIEEVKVGDILRIRPGEKVPLDGVIIDGLGVIDASLVTGESMPTEKMTGDRVVGATMNTTGSFIMRVEKIGDHTLLAQMVQMAREVQKTSLPIQRLADQFSFYFIPSVFLVSLTTCAVWWTIGPDPRWMHAVINAVSVLIIACPCAVGLATPLSILVGTGRGATLGVLVRNVEAIESLSKIDVLLIDKTGTLTEGKPQLTHLTALNHFKEKEVLFFAATLEKGSEHPFAQAIIREAEKKKIILGEAKDFKAIPGKGVVGRINGRHVAVGNTQLLDAYKMKYTGIAESVNLLRNKGQTIMYVAIDHTIAGLISVADPIKPSSRGVIAALARRGISIIMVTGDNPITAQAIADQVGIECVEANVLPKRKMAIVRHYQDQGFTVAMAGDGINDSAALAQANVGIAMGNGTDVAIESADIVLVKGDLLGILRAMALSKAIMRNIRQNLFFSFVYNIAGIVIAFGVLYPLWGILLSPTVAALAMSTSSLCVILNALRLRRFKGI